MERSRALFFFMSKSEFIEMKNSQNKVKNSKW